MSSVVDKRLRFSAIDKVSSVTDRIGSKFPKLTKNVQRANKSFERLEKSTATVKRNLSRIGGTVRNVGLGMTAGLTLPILAFGAQMFETSRTFDQSMNKVQALTGASTKEIMAMRNEAKKLGSTTAFSASQASDAMAFFGQAGFNTNQILKATAPTLALAAASATDLATTADIASNIMGGFNIKADEMTRVADVLALTTAKGNVNLEMMGETMKDAAPVALKYGATLEETSALVAKLGDAGIQGSKAGTTLKNMFLQLTTATPRVQKILQALGVKAIDPSTGKMRKMTDILVDLNKGFKGKNISEAKRLAILNEVFGKRAIAGAGVLLDAVAQTDKKTGKLVNTVAELEDKLKGSTGAASRMQNTLEKGLPGAVNSFKSAWEGVQLAFADSGIKDTIASILRGLTSLFQWVSRLNPTILKWVSIMALVVAAIGPVVAFIGMMIALMPALITGWNVLTVAITGSQVAFLPLLLIMLKFIAIAALVATAATMIYKNWQPIKQFFVDFFKAPIEQAKDLFKWIGKITGISSLLGFGDKTDENLKKQGFKIEGAKGSPTSSESMTKKNFEFQQRKIQAGVDIKFSNMPKDTRVMTDDRDSLLNIDTGMMGAI